MKAWLLLVATAILWLAVSAASPSAWAQTPPPSKEEAARVLSILKDDAKRAELIRTLETLSGAAAAPTPSPPPTPVGALGDLLAHLADSVGRAGTLIAGAADSAADLPKLWRWLKGLADQPEVLRATGMTLGKIMLVVAVAWAVEGVFSRLTLRARRRWTTRPEASAEAPDAVRDTSRRARLAPAFAQIALDAAGIVAFALAAFAALSAVDAPFRVNLAAIAVINANLAARIGRAVGRAIFAPDAPALRLIPISDETAAYLFIWLRRFVDIAAVGWFGLHAAQLLGLPDPLFSLAAQGLGLGLAALAAVFVLQNRKPTALLLQTLAVNRLAATGTWRGAALRAAEIWHVPTLIYIAAAWAVWALGAKGGFHAVLRVSALTVLVAALTQIADGMVRRGLDRLLTVGRDMVDRLPGLQARANLYLPGLRNGLRALVLTCGGALLLQVWGVDIVGWLGSPAGRRTLGSLVSVTLMIVGALVLWEVSATLIERAMGEADGQAAAERSSRSKTLLPLLRNAIKVTLVVVVGLMVLSELGVNIAPLLAGAGVLGLAIGFGAQTLVRDVITGLFILFEDSIRIGDVVTVGGKTGTVVGLTIRAVTLRDAEGVLVSAPFSTISVVENMTKDFSYYTIDLPIEAGRDVDAAIRALSEVDAELRADPAFAAQILAPLDVLGVAKIEPTLSTLRARAKTAPGRQWTVGREYNRRLMTRLRAAGVWGPLDVAG